MRCEFSLVAVANRTVYLVDTGTCATPLTDDAAEVVRWVQKKFRCHDAVYLDRHSCWAKIILTSKNEVRFLPLTSADIPDVIAQFVTRSLEWVSTSKSPER